MLWSVRVMAALLVAGTAAAQSPGTFFLGGYGQLTHFDSKWKLDSGLGNTLGVGLRVGAFVSPSWSIEADASYTPAEFKEGTSFQGSRDAKASSLTARAVYTFPSASQRSFHVGGGGVLENARSDTDARAATYGYGVNALAGMTFGARNFAARVDALMNYIPSNGIRLDLGVQAGVQFSPNLFGATSSLAPSGAPIVWWDELTAPLPGTMEIGGSLQQSNFEGNPRQVNPRAGNFGYAARIGVFLGNPRWEIEADGYYSPQDTRIPTGVFNAAARPTEANASAFAARLNYNAPIETTEELGHQSALLVGLGVVRTNYKFMGGTGFGNINETYTYNLGVSGLAGFRWQIANRTAIRLDGIADWMPRHKPKANVNLHLRAGLSVLVGGARPEAVCPFPGLGNVAAVSPQCVAPVAPVAPPPPPPPPPPAPLGSGA
jgi:hypothetical protein